MLMIQNNKVVPLAMAALLSGCGVLSPSEEAPIEVAERTETPAITSLGNDEVLSRLGVIPAQQVATGECGLFLWAKREDAPLIFFQRSNGDALVRVDGQVQSLTRTFLEDQIALQFHRNQQFTVSDMTVRVSITPEETQTLQQGLKIPSGGFSISTESGWSAALPVAGAIGCQ